MSGRTLWDLTPNQQALVKSIGLDCSELFKGRLGDLGFYPGERIICIRRTPFGGPRIYQVGASVFSLAEDIATAVLVDEV
jgi:ferrous iron transport protein A